MHALTAARSRQRTEHKTQQDLDRNHLRHQNMFMHMQCVWVCKNMHFLFTVRIYVYVIFPMHIQSQRVHARLFVYTIRILSISMLLYFPSCNHFAVNKLSHSWRPNCAVWIITFLATQLCCVNCHIPGDPISPSSLSASEKQEKSPASCQQQCSHCVIHCALGI